MSDRLTRVTFFCMFEAENPWFSMLIQAIEGANSSLGLEKVMSYIAYHQRKYEYC